MVVVALMESTLRIRVRGICRGRSCSHGMLCV
jgi:hypothetical protein